MLDSPPKRPQISKFRSRIFCCCDSARFLEPFWHQFCTILSNIAWFPKRLICNKYQAYLFFSRPKSYFGITFRSKCYFVFGFVFGHPFFAICPTWCSANSFLRPLWDAVGFKRPPNICQVVPKDYPKASQETHFLFFCCKSSKFRFRKNTMWIQF